MERSIWRGLGSAGGLSRLLGGGFLGEPGVRLFGNDFCAPSM
jgi:hypothetical protein